MAIALDPKTPIRYVIQSDRHLDEEDQTVWLIKPLLRSEMVTVLDRFSNMEAGDLEDADQKKAKEHMDEVSGLLTTYIVGWENFKDANGKEVKFVPATTNIKRNKNLDYIPISMMSELVEGIFEANRLTDDDLKN